MKSSNSSAKPPSVPPSIDRLPPHAPEAEAGVIACILIEPDRAIPVCLEKFSGNGETFYDLRNRGLFNLLTEMYDTRTPIDLLTVRQFAQDRHQLDELGGVAYLASLPDSVASAANIEYYAGILHEKYVLRRMIATCNEGIARVYEDESSPQETLEEVERQILEINTQHTEQGIVPILELVRRAIETIEKLHQGQGALTGIATGFVDLDKMTSGLHPGEMIIIAGRPGQGKSAAALNIAEYAAVDHQIPTGIFSLEMSADSLMLRLLCGRARVNMKNMRDGFMAERDFPRLTHAAGKISTAPLFIDDTSGLSILQLRARARRMAQQQGIKLLIIDYLQLLHSTSRKADNRQQEVSDISRGAKALSKELGIPVIALSQLNRDVERIGGKPRLCQLREGGNLEGDADIVGLLYSPKDKDDDEDNYEREAVPVNLLIAKNRHGPTGEVPLTFLRSYTRFESAFRVSHEDVPEQRQFPDA